MTPTLSTLIGTKKTEREGLKQEMPRKEWKGHGRRGRQYSFTSQLPKPAQLCVKKEVASRCSLSLFWPLAQLSQRRPC